MHVCTYDIFIKARTLCIYTCVCMFECIIYLYPVIYMLPIYIYILIQFFIVPFIAVFVDTRNKYYIM